MKRLVLSLFFLIAICSFLAASFEFGRTGNPASQRPPFNRVDLTHGQKYVPGEVLVRFKRGTSRQAMLATHARLGTTLNREFASVPGLHHVKFSADIPVKRALRLYRKDPNVLYAEPNYVLHRFNVPNDPLFSQQWALANTGQSGGTAGADINATQAWGISTGSSNVVVAVIDTGIDYNHPDLAPNIWSSPTSFTQTYGQYTINCPAGSHGYTPSAGNPYACDPMDLDGHGTHVAGIIGAVGNNNLGVSGVNWNVQLMACKMTEDLDTTSGAIDCLDFVKAMKDQGVNIIATSNSYGGTEVYSQALIDAIAAQQQDGILFVAAAGNSFQDNDLVPIYPASLFLPNIISVAATDRNDQMAAFSNFGRYSTHLGAPGVDVLSTLPGQVYGVDTGTSMSTPFVTGVAALLKAAHPSWDWRTIRNQILAGGDTIPALANTITGKRLNAYGALTCSNSTIGSRLQPTMPNAAGAVGAPTLLAYLNINCGLPNGSVTVQSSSGDTITLVDDGTNGDQAAGDGIYTGQWTPAALGSYTLSFPGGDNVNVQVLANYIPSQVTPSDYQYQNISGTNLNLGDDSVATISSPFPIQFGGGSFSNLYVSSNGTISFTDVFGQFDDYPLPLGATYGIFPPAPYAPVTTLVAPFWQDLYPVEGTANNVFWDVTGSAPNRELVVEWRNVESYACQGNASATVTFQVVFTEGSSNVLVNYANTEFGGNCLDEDHGAEATVGIQVAPTVASLWGFDESVLANNSGILWETSTGTQASNPVPVITSVSPSTVQAGGSDVPITIAGSNFLPQSQAHVNSSPRPTMYVSSTELQVLILASDIQYNGVVTIQVYNPTPGGGYSNSVNVTAGGQSAPIITSISPASVVAGSYGFYLQVTGAGFTSNSSAVQWSGTALPGSYQGPNQLQAEVSSNLIATAGTVQITVNNGTEGGVSNAITLTITAQASGSSGVSGSTAKTPSPGSNPSRYAVPGTIPSANFLPRFMGWRVAQKEGPQYVEHFLRTHAGITGTAAHQLRENALSQTVSSQALPGFQFRPSFPADLIPTSVATGDFNGDGHMDWVVANGAANTLWVYLGNGDGTAQPPSIIPLKGQSPAFVATADLRGNGVLDLIVAEADSGQIGVLLGNGDGTFGAETPYFVPGAPTCLLIDDFNGDGRKDILVGMEGDYTVGEITLFPGDGTGHFGAPVYQPYQHPYGNTAVFSIPYALAEADLNGDGFPDLAIADETELVDGTISDAYVLINQKDGTFKPGQVVDFRLLQNLTSVALGDVNGDGCPDLVDTDTWGVASLFLGDCQGSFQVPSAGGKFGVGDIAGALALADVNGDGKLDIVTSSVVVLDTTIYGVQPGNLVSVLLGDGQGNFGNARVFRGGPSAYSLALADLNGDGKLDVVTANQDADSVSTFLNDGTGGFGQPQGEYLGWLWPDANGVSGAINDIYSNPSNSNCLLKVADINADGKPDLAILEWTRTSLNAVYLAALLNNGSGQFASPIRSAVLDGSYTSMGDYALANFRGTGLPDFLAIGASSTMGSSYIAFAKNNGDGTFTPLPVAQPAGAEGMLALGDFNGDGKTDFVAVGSTVNVFLSNGDGTFSAGPTLTFPASTQGYYPGAVWVGDFNGDGRLDILVQLTSTLEGVQHHDVYEFLGNGNGTFAAGKDVLQNVGPMNVADLNHDGIGDIVAIVEPLTTIGQNIPLQYAVYLGQHDGSFVLQNTYQLNAGVVSLNPAVLLCDFNGDGNTDIAAYQLTGGGPSAWGGQDTVLQILAGNGDGTFTPTFTTFNFNQYVAPPFTADLNGDGKSDLFELDGWGSAFQVVPANVGPALQIGILTYPIFGSTAAGQVTVALASSTATTVQLSASDPNITVPANITIPANSASQTFQIQIGSGFNANHVFGITATVNGQSATAWGWETIRSQGTFVMSTTNYPSQTIVPGQTTGQYGFAVSSIFDYSTDVQFSCTDLPAWAACQFGQSTMYLAPGGSFGASWVVTATSAAVTGTYPFTMIATDGLATQQLNATLNIGDFGISITPASAIALTTGSATYNLAINPINGYGGPVQTNVSGLPTGATVSCCLASLGGGSNTSLDIQTTNVAVGTYTFTVTGTAGSLTRSATAMLVVQSPPPGFSGTISPSSATLSVGQSANFNITLTSANGATGAVTLQCMDMPSGSSCSFNPGTPNLPANGNVTDQLTVQVSSRPSSAPPGAPTTWPPPIARLPVAGLLACLVVALVVAWGIEALVASRGNSWWTLRRATATTALSIALLLFLATASCGGGGGGGGGSSAPPGTPQAVTFTFNVQATGAGVSTPQSIGTITITVN